MKEMLVKIPDENFELATQLLEKLDAKVSEKKTKTNPGPRKKKSATKSVNAKKKKKSKIDHTYLFGKWKDFEIDPKKLRQEAW